MELQTVWEAAIVLARVIGGPELFDGNERNFMVIPKEDVNSKHRLNEFIDSHREASVLSMLYSSIEYLQVESEEKERNKAEVTFHNALYHFLKNHFTLRNATNPLCQKINIGLSAAIW